MKKISGIYSITAPSGNCYVGSSTNIRQRWRDHCGQLRRGVHTNTRLQAAHHKYGWDLTYQLLEECPQQILHEREQVYIDNLKSVYNLSRSAANVMRDPMVVAKHLESVRTPEHRACMSAGSSKMWADPEIRERLTTLTKDRHLVPGFTVSLRQAIINYKNTPEAIAKQSALLASWFTNPKNKAKHVARMVEQWKDPDHRQAHAEKLRAWHVIPGNALLASKNAIAGWDNPERRVAQSTLAKSLNSDPAFQANRIVNITMKAQAKRDKALIEHGLLLYTPKHLRRISREGIGPRTPRQRAANTLCLAILKDKK